MTDTKKTLSQYITEEVRNSGRTYGDYAREIGVEVTTFKSWVQRNAFPLGHLDSIRTHFTDLATNELLRKTYDFHLARGRSRVVLPENRTLQFSSVTIAHLQVVAQESLKEFGDVLPKQGNPGEGGISFAQLSDDLRTFIESRDRLHQTFQRLTQAGFNVRGFNQLSPERQTLLSEALCLATHALNK